MNQPDYSQAPRDVPVFLNYLLGLPSDATRQEIEREWTNQVVPLLNVGPQHLFDREHMALMGAGITGEQARRVFKQTKRGAMLADSAEREAAARKRKDKFTPPFLKGS